MVDECCGSEGFVGQYSAYSSCATALYKLALVSSRFNQQSTITRHALGRAWSYNAVDLAEQR